MNELRMYVEHLFEGKVLTAEMIELKEEMYGNLVARYEDYLAGGMDAAEALEKTKASITSVEDVLAGEEADEAAEAVASTTRSDAAAGPAAEEPAPPAAVPSPSAPQAKVPAAETTVLPGATTARPAGAPVPPQKEPELADLATPAMARKITSRVLIAGLIALVFVVFAVFLGAMAVGCVSFGVTDGAQGEVTTTSTVQGTGNGAADGVTGNGNNSTAGNGNAAGNGDAAGNGNAAGNTGQGQSTTPRFEDPEDQAEYEATSALDSAIANQTAASLAEMAGTGSASASMVQSLPLSEYAGSTGSDTQQVRFNVRYDNVSDLIDSDAIDRALLYNTTALMSAHSGIQQVTITVHEQYDSDYDTDTYTFDRATLEHAYSNASNGAIAALDSSLFASEETWQTVRDYVFRENFCERQVDFAEVE